MTDFFSHDAEKGVLASLLLSPSVVFAACARAGISGSSFSNPAFFDTLRAMFHSGKPLDFISITHALRDAGVLEQVGGAAAVSELFTYLPTAANHGHYIEILTAHELYRNAHGLLRSHLEELSCAGAREQVAALQSGALALISPRKQRVQKSEVLKQILKEIVSGHDDSALLPTGIEAIDSEVRLHRSDYAVIPGPTSSGKSALAANIAVSMAKLGRRVAYFPLEMSTKQILKRALASESGYNGEYLRKLYAGTLHASDETKQSASDLYSAAVGVLNSIDLVIIDDIRDLDGIMAEVRGLHAEKPVDLVVVDYLQLISVKGSHERRQLALAHASRSFKMLACEISGLVITPSQVNKEGGTREAADLENDANCILSIHVTEDDGRDVIVAKQRDGKRGQTLALEWEGHLTRFK